MRLQLRAFLEASTYLEFLESLGNWCAAHSLSPAAGIASMILDVRLQLMALLKGAMCSEGLPNSCVVHSNASPAVGIASMGGRLQLALPR